MKERDAAGLRRYAAWCAGADRYSAECDAALQPLDAERLRAYAEHLRATVDPKTEAERLWGLLNALRAREPAADHVWMEQALRERWTTSPARRLSNGPGRGSASKARLRRLRVEEWPAAYQDAWKAACAGDLSMDAGGVGGFSLLKRIQQPRQPQGLATRWAPDTIERRIRAMGSFLWYLAGKGAPLEITEAGVESYIAAMKDRGLAPRSQATEAVALLRICEAMWPQRDWRWLQDRAYGLHDWAEAQPPSRCASAKYVPMKDLRAYARRIMEDASSMPKGRKAAGTFQRGLILLFLSYHPVRLQNLTNLVVHVPGVTAEPDADMGRLLIEPDKPIICSWPKTKVKGVIRVERLALALVEPMRQWLDVWRPCLATKQSGCALWLSNSPDTIGQPMTEGGISEVVQGTMEKRFGKRIGTHAFRHIAATTIVEFAPDQAHMIPKVLNHSSSRSARHYVQAAKTVMAARMYEEILTRVSGFQAPNVRFARSHKYSLGLASGRETTPLLSPSRP